MLLTYIAVSFNATTIITKIMKNKLFSTVNLTFDAVTYHVTQQVSTIITPLIDYRIFGTRSSHPTGGGVCS